MLQLLHQDDALVAVNKPAGMLVHRTGLDAGETQFVLQQLRDQLGRAVYPLHRLDKGTSGVLLFALSPDAARLGQAMLQAASTRKVYHAIVRGWPAAAGTIDHPLKRMPDDMRTERMEVQDARTHFATLAQMSLPLPYGTFDHTRLAWVTAEPETGRRHQIRRHFKHIAHPLIGDATHGKGPLNRAIAAHVGTQRLWLHAQTLQGHHPVSGRPLRIEAPLPPEWAIWQALCPDGRPPF